MILTDSRAPVLILLLLISWPPECRAGIDPLAPRGGRAAALAQAYSGFRADFWGIFANPAGIAGLERPSAALVVSQSFMLAALNQGGAAVVMPFQQNTQAIGLSVLSFGFAAYRENRVGLNYALSAMQDNLSVGVRLNGLSISIPGYGSASAAYVDAGVQVRLSSALTAGFYAANVNRARLRSLQSPREDMPGAAAAGISYRAGSKALFCADIRKDTGFPMSFGAGIEYQPVESLALRAGAGTQPLRWSAGAGINRGGFQFDAALTFHERLGYSPTFSLQYALKGAK